MGLEAVSNMGVVSCAASDADRKEPPPPPTELLLVVRMPPLSRKCPFFGVRPDCDAERLGKCTYCYVCYQRWCSEHKLRVKPPEVFEPSLLDLIESEDVRLRRLVFEQRLRRLIVQKGFGYFFVEAELDEQDRLNETLFVPPRFEDGQCFVRYEHPDFGDCTFSFYATLR